MRLSFEIIRWDKVEGQWQKVERPASNEKRKEGDTLGDAKPAVHKWWDSKSKKHIESSKAPKGSNENP